MNLKIKQFLSKSKKKKDTINSSMEQLNGTKDTAKQRINKQ